MFIEIDTEYGNTIINTNHIIEIYMDDPEYLNELVVDKVNIKLINNKVYTRLFENEDENICFKNSMEFFDILRKMLKPLREEDFLQLL